MIIPVFKDISCEDFYEVSLSPRDDRLFWLQDCPKLNFNLVEDNYIDINFSIEDLGTHFRILVYNNTNYTNIMSDLKTVADYLLTEGFKGSTFSLCFSSIIANLKRTKSRKEEIDFDYKDLINLDYLWTKSGQKRIMTGVSTLKNNFFEIKLKLIKNEQSWSCYYAVVLDEPDPEIRKMKSYIVRKYFKETYRY